VTAPNVTPELARAPLLRSQWWEPRVSEKRLRGNKGLRDLFDASIWERLPIKTIQSCRPKKIERKLNFDRERLISST
jgi:hypothetical protein